MLRQEVVYNIESRMILDIILLLGLRFFPRGGPFVFGDRGTLRFVKILVRMSLSFDLHLRILILEIEIFLILFTFI